MKELKPLKNIIDSLRLNVHEKNEGRDRFLAFMEKHPVEKKRLGAKFLESFASLHRPARLVASSLGILVVFCSSISYAADSSLPGDTLYPIKIYVNEEVQGFFQFTPEAKAAWELERMERRIQEAETLTNSGKLDTKAKAKLEEALEAYSAEMNLHLDELQAQDGEEETELFKKKQNTLFQHFKELEQR